MFNLSSNNDFETSRRWKLFRYTVNNRIQEASVQLKSDFTEFPWSTIILNEYIFIILFIRMRITGENRGEQGRTGEWWLITYEQKLSRVTWKFHTERVTKGRQLSYISEMIFRLMLQLWFLWWFWNRLSRLLAFLAFGRSFGMSRNNPPFASIMLSLARNRTVASLFSFCITANCCDCASLFMKIWYWCLLVCIKYDSSSPGSCLPVMPKFEAAISLISLIYKKWPIYMAHKGHSPHILVFDRSSHR